MQLHFDLAAYTGQEAMSRLVRASAALFRVRWYSDVPGKVRCSPAIANIGICHQMKLQLGCIVLVLQNGSCMNRDRTCTVCVHVATVRFINLCAMKAIYCA